MLTVVWQFSDSERCDQILCGLVCRCDGDVAGYIYGRQAAAAADATCCVAAKPTNPINVICSVDCELISTFRDGLIYAHTTHRSKYVLYISRSLSLCLCVLDCIDCGKCDVSGITSYRLSIWSLLPDGGKHTASHGFNPIANGY